MVGVLIIEDDPMVAEINKKYIEKLNDFQVMGVARNGAEGYKMIKELNPVLIILDINTTKLSGLELLKRIRREGILIDVIIVTEVNKSLMVNEVLKLGVIDYLIKPFAFQRLKLTLEAYKERISILKDRESLTQKDIDSLMVGRRNKTVLMESEKGIHQKTIDIIRKYLSAEEKASSAVEVAKALGISRVTARRYLEYMSEGGEVELIISYGTIGRPIHCYLFKKP